ncbi:MAG: carboxypeptidase regulatory-like domain-containing protein [Patescibacteria group bacterium]|nr:carboxypeptidase regulatory-like domain-containing protein [Patescibacteria group bacterium]
MFSFVSKLFSAVAITALLVLPVSSALAALATPASDTIETHTTGAQANHQIVLKTPSGIDAPTDYIDVAMPDFVFGLVGVGDIDLSYGPVTGFENALTLAGAAGVGVWGVSIIGTTIRFTAPTDAALGTVPSNNLIGIKIGTNAVGGTNKLTNPGSAMTAQVTIGGTFGDSNTLGVVIVDNSSVAVSATVAATTTTSTPPDGGGGGGQNPTPPVVYNIQVINITSNSVTVTWLTDVLANSTVQFGTDFSYASGTVSDATYTLSHSINLSGLTPSTLYHFIVSSTDQASLSTTSADQTFTTSGDLTLPVISNVHVVNITDTSAIIVWDTDEPANSTVDYGITSGYGQVETLAGYVTTHAVPISGLQEGTLYHFKVTSSDVANNSTSTEDYTFTTTIDSTAPANVSDLTATPGDTIVTLNWNVPPDPDFAGTRIVRKEGGYPTGPNDGILVYQGAANTSLDSGLTNGVTYYYAAYAYDTHNNFASGALASATPVGPIVLPPTSTPPIPPVPTSTPPLPPVTTTTPPIVTPPIVPPVTTTTPPIVTPPIVVPTTTLPVEPGITILAQYYGADGRVELVPDAAGRIGVLSGSTVTVVVPVIGLGEIPIGATLSVASQIAGYYALVYDSSQNAYTGSFVAPETGIYEATVTVIFQNGTSGTRVDFLNSQQGGVVREDDLLGEQGLPVAGATVRLYQQLGGEWVLYGQETQTSADGVYTYVVPNGRYYVNVSKDGFREKTTEPIFVNQNVFNQNVALIKVPLDKPLIEGAPLATNLSIIAGNAIEDVGYGIKVIRAALDAPVVQTISSTASPLLLSVSLINTVSAISLFNSLAYLQYFFTQPILLFGRKRRKKWGVVYNSLSKQPVDLAIMRLTHFETKLVMQTSVTDKAGRYRFLVKPGNYLIEVVKPGYVFPTEYLKGKAEDVEFLDLYHGDKLESPSDGVLAFNVPIDPITREETPRRIFFKKSLQLIRHGVAFMGIPVGMIILIITPSVPNALLLVSQVGIYLLFRRLALPIRPKSWGIVLDSKTKKPLANVIIRIFDKKFNKLLETQVTDRNGKYGFFVKRNIYYVTAEKPGFKKYVSPDIDLSGKEEAIIDQNVILQSVDK